MMRKRIYTDKGTDFMVIPNTDTCETPIDGQAVIQVNMPNWVTDR